MDRNAANLDIIRRAYVNCFSKPKDSAIVLTHLEQECFGRKPTFDVTSDRQTAFNEGRRSVWLGIQATLALTAQDMEQIAERAEAFFEEED